MTFFSLDEINEAIAPLRDALNDRPDEGIWRPESPGTLPALRCAARPRRLPAEPFQVTDAHYGMRVPRSYQLKYDHHYYSVPHTLIDHHVDLFLVGDVLEIYHHGTHVVRHAKQPPDGQQTVLDAHRARSASPGPAALERRYLHVAEVIGPYTRAVVEALYVRMKHDEQAHRAAQGLIRLCKHYDSERVEAAAARAIYFQRPAIRDIKQILAQGLDQQPLPGTGQRVFPFVTHANLRGADYYQEDN